MTCSFINGFGQQCIDEEVDLVVYDIPDATSHLLLPLCLEHALTLSVLQRLHAGGATVR